LFCSVRRVGTISFGEFSAVLEQSDPVPHAESSISEAAGVDATDASFTEASSLSITAGTYYVISSSVLNTHVFAVLF